MRVRVLFDDLVLQSVGLHSDWKQIWFRPSDEAKSVADLLIELWELVGVSSPPNVKVAWAGFFIPVRSPVDVLQDLATMCIHDPSMRLPPAGAEKQCLHMDSHKLMCTYAQRRQF
jgi:hypothetical protein